MDTIKKTRNLNPGTSLKFTLQGIDFEAFTVAGFASYVAIPKFDICFDLGFAPIELHGINNIFLSHVHLDHMAGLPMYLAQRHMKSHQLAKVYTPEESAPGLLEVLLAIEKMEGGSIPVRDIVHTVKPWQKIPLTKEIHIETFPVNHVLQSLGFSVVETKKKLKQEFLSLEGQEIKALREAGTAINDVVERRLLTYVGDSTTSTYTASEQVANLIKTSEILFVEITHLQDRNSAGYGHTTLPGFLKFWDEHHAMFDDVKTIVFKHFSMRSSLEEIEEAINTQFPKKLLERSFFLL